MDIDKQTKFYKDEMRKLLYFLYLLMLPDAVPYPLKKSFGDCTVYTSQNCHISRAYCYCNFLFTFE